MTANKNMPVILALCLVVFAAYFRVKDCGFVNYDDYKYVIDNYNIQGGITIDSLMWALKTSYFSYWHPLTWVSHMADIELFGLNPCGPHVVSLIIHMGAAAALFLFLRYATGELWQSAFVAAAFAVHPINVESVAWISERKSVLCALWWFITASAYVHYVRGPAAGRYIIVMLCFMLALMSKPMAVTLPIVMLILDFWPLGRVTNKTKMMPLIIEKTPFFALSLLSGILTIYGQAKNDAVAGVNESSIAFRLASAALSYVTYLGKAVWPVNLCVFYPYKEISSVWPLALSLLALAALTAAAVWLRKSRPYVLAGWAWFVVTLIPVLQFVQVSAAPVADRYAYIPFVGLFITASWGVYDLFRKYRTIALVIGICVVIVMSFLTYKQTAYWHDTGTLFKHAIEVTENNYLAHNLYGTHLLSTGRTDEAIEEFKTALAVMPDYPGLNFNMWSALTIKGLKAEAEPYFEKSLPYWDKEGEMPVLKLGISFLKQRNYDVAGEFFLKALVIAPRNILIYKYIGMSLIGLKRYEDALSYIDKGIAAAPDIWELYFQKGLILKEMGQRDEAVSNFKEALRRAPNRGNIAEIISKNIETATERRRQP
ncbi:MAG: tetratricopeptide repeat protein [Candidatus Magnetominusculus sp. LBB02]|nr:tetratricopeptide repeat protein [Candidatus Magnetominusculus sp. LBB02]